MAAIAPDKISSKELEAAFNEKDYLKRAEMVLEWADRLGCRKFVTAQDIIDVRFFLPFFLLQPLFSFSSSTFPPVPLFALFLPTPQIPSGFAFPN